MVITLDKIGNEIAKIDFTNGRIINYFKIKNMALSIFISISNVNSFIDMSLLVLDIFFHH